MRIFVLFISISIVFLGMGCSDSESEPTAAGDKSPSGFTRSASDCKSQMSHHIQPKTCVQYSFHYSGILKVSLINYHMNCCPATTEADITIENGNIYIDHSRWKNQCSCLCYFDLEYEIVNLPASNYILHIAGLSISLNLNEEHTGLECA